MINIFLEPFYDMFPRILIIIVILSIIGIVLNQMEKSIIGLVILFVFFISMALQPSTTYMNIFLSVINMAP